MSAISIWPVSKGSSRRCAVRLSAVSAGAPWSSSSATSRKRDRIGWKHRYARRRPGSRSRVRSRPGSAPSRHRGQCRSRSETRKPRRTQADDDQGRERQSDALKADDRCHEHRSGMSPPGAGGGQPPGKEEETLLTTVCVAFVAGFLPAISHYPRFQASTAELYINVLPSRSIRGDAMSDQPLWSPSPERVRSHPGHGLPGRGEPPAPARPCELSRPARLEHHAP